MTFRQLASSNVPWHVRLSAYYLNFMRNYDHHTTRPLARTIAICIIPTASRALSFPNRCLIHANIFPYDGRLLKAAARIARLSGRTNP